MIENVLQQKWLEAMAVVSLHVLGCLVFTALGVLIWRGFH
ncbi:CrcB protein [Pasteurella multocida subsp. multocida OH4807]|nr:CrcB protein [Pasteurella multocida subsp. multocida OH4807]